MDCFLFFNFVVVFFFSFLVPFFMYFFSLVVSYKELIGGKLDSYECGFVVNKKVDVSFNVVFFSIVVMFIVFEFEVIFFIIMVLGDVYSIFSFFMFFVYVVGSFYLEWYFGKLIWFF